MVEDVPSLVHLTPLHHGAVTEDVADRLAQRLAAVDDEEPRAGRGEAARDEVLQHPLACDLVLRRALPEANGQLSSDRSAGRGAQSLDTLSQRRLECGIGARPHLVECPLNCQQGRDNVGFIDLPTAHDGGLV